MSTFQEQLSCTLHYDLLGPPISIGVTRTENGQIEYPSAVMVILIVPFASSSEYTA